jgi:hypothetical protein
MVARHVAVPLALRTRAQDRGRKTSLFYVHILAVACAYEEREIKMSGRLFRVGRKGDVKDGAGRRVEIPDKEKITRESPCEKEDSSCSACSILLKYFSSIETTTASYKICCNKSNSRLFSVGIQHGQ